MNNSKFQVTFCLIGFLFITISTFTQAQIDWIYHKSIPGNDIGETIIQTNDGGYIAAGAQRINNSGDDWAVVKLDADGNEQWRKSFGLNTSNDRAQGIVQTADDGYVITGSLSAPNTGGQDFVVVKLDPDGEIVWEQFYDLYFPFVNSLSLTADGGFMVAGNSLGLGTTSDSDGLFRKLDAEGNLEWEKHYGGSSTDEIFSIVQTEDLGYIAAGCSRSSDGDIKDNYGSDDIWVIKMDANGNLEWSKNYGGSNQDVSRSVQQAVDGGFLVAGYTSSSDKDVIQNYGDEDIWLLKLSPDGIIEWSQNYGGQDEDRAQSMVKVSSGGYAIGGWSRSNDGDLSENRGLIDIWIFTVDYAGNITWQNNFGGSRVDQCLDIKETSDGGFIATGNTYSNNGDFGINNDSDLYILKLTPLAVGLSDSDFDENINIFPNPNSGQFYVDASSVSEPIKINIFDLQGKHIYAKSYKNNNEPISIDVNQKGLFIIRVSSEGNSYYEKILIE